MLIARRLMAAVAVAALAGGLAGGLPGCNSIYHKGTRDMAPEAERFGVRVREAREAGAAWLAAGDVARGDAAGAAWEFERRVLSARDVFERLEEPSVAARVLMRAFDAAVRDLNDGTPDARTSVRGAVLLAERYEGEARE